MTVRDVAYEIVKTYLFGQITNLSEAQKGIEEILQKAKDEWQNSIFSRLKTK